MHIWMESGFMSLSFFIRATICMRLMGQLLLSMNSVGLNSKRLCKCISLCTHSCANEYLLIHVSNYLKNLSSKVPYTDNIFTYLDGFMMPLTSFRMPILAPWELHDTVFTRPCSNDKFSPFFAITDANISLHTFFFSICISYLALYYLVLHDTGLFRLREEAYLLKIN